MSVHQRLNVPLRRSCIALFARGRELGFVILISGQLQRYGVKTFKGTKQGAVFAQKVRDTIDTLIADDCPDRGIVIERSDDRLPKGVLCQFIENEAEQWNQSAEKLSLISLHEAKAHLCQTPKATHAQLREAIVRKYPILWSLIQKKKGPIKYWEKVCFALALAEVAFFRAG